MLSTGAAAARSFYENVVALSLNLSDFKVWARFSELGFILRWVAVHGCFFWVRSPFSWYSLRAVPYFILNDPEAAEEQ